MADKELVTQDAATLEALDKAKILDELYDNKDTRPLVLRGIKTIRPSARIPEIESADAVMAAITPHVEAIGQTKEVLAKELAAVRADRAKETAQRELGLTEEEYVEVTKLAEDKKIGDLTTAAEHWRFTREAGEPRPGPETTFHMPNYKGLAENPVQWARDEARKVQHELELAKRRR